MPATAIATDTRLKVSLNVTDLTRSVRFYLALLAIEPSMHGSQQVCFELNDPPVTVCLVPGGPVNVGSINHIGFRLPDSAALVEVQRHLEEAGIATQRQEGVECCYARQTKFWVTDPDRNLWELYVLEEDIDHSGFEDAPRPAPVPADAVWEHRLTEPVPGHIDRPDASLDEVHLEGSCNARLEDLRPAVFLAEIFRVLRPGGKVIMHGLVGDRAVETPALPGLAALVQRVPALAECIDTLRGAGFGALYYEKLADVTCIDVTGAGLHEMRLVGWCPGAAAAGRTHRVLYKGPLARVTGEDGTVYPRGESVTISQAASDLLRAGPAAGQFLFYPDEKAN
jgi:catechol 2,3-dioxygenase-like lactoylglutathione lyase family enzyme